MQRRARISADSIGWQYIRQQSSGCTSGSRGPGSADSIGRQYIRQQRAGCTSGSRGP